MIHIRCALGLVFILDTISMCVAMAQDSPDEATVIRRLEELHCIVTRDHRLPDSPVVSFELGSKPRFSDKHMYLLKAFKHLTNLDLGGLYLSSDGLRELRQLMGVTILDVSQTRLTDAGLKEVASLKNLAMLSTRNNAITDAGLNELKKLKGLEVLDLGVLSGHRYNPLTGFGLKCLKDLERLTTLKLDGVKLTDAGLTELGKLRNIKEPRQNKLPQLVLSQMANDDTISSCRTRQSSKPLKASISNC